MSIIFAVCGGKQAKTCPKTGLPHRMESWVELKDNSGRVIGASVSCADCGKSAILTDLLELP